MMTNGAGMFEPNQEPYAVAARECDDEAQLELLAELLKAEFGQNAAVSNTGGGILTLTVSAGNASFEFGTADETWSGTVAVNEQEKGVMQTGVMVSEPNPSLVCSAILAAIKRFDESGQPDLSL